MVFREFPTKFGSSLKGLSILPFPCDFFPKDIHFKMFYTMIAYYIVLHSNLFAKQYILEIVPHQSL